MDAFCRECADLECDKEFKWRTFIPRIQCISVTMLTLMTDPTAIAPPLIDVNFTNFIPELNPYDAFMSAVHDTDNDCDISSKYDSLGNVQYGCTMSYYYSQNKLLR